MQIGRAALHRRKRTVSILHKSCAYQCLCMLQLSASAKKNRQHWLMMTKFEIFDTHSHPHTENTLRETTSQTAKPLIAISCRDFPHTDG